MAMASLQPALAASVITVTGGLARPPMPASSSAALFALAQQVARHQGLGDLTGVAVGGGSDGNFTGALGIPTLDGLGAVGSGAHTDAEYVEIATLPERTALFDVVLSGKVRIEINQTYPLAEVAQAHRDLEGRKTTGSTILVP
jgi:glutamate carboxypeptidase